MPAELLAVPVVSKNGLHGKVFTFSKLLDDSPEKKIVWETGREVMIPSKHLHLRLDGTYYLNLTVDPTRQDPGAGPAAITDKIVIPRIEEYAEVTKRVVETGRVRVSRTVTDDPATIDEPTIHEEYDVKHVPVNRVVEEPSEPRREGDTMIIPVYEEVIVKQLILREEIHLIKKRRETHEPKTISLRKEQIHVEHVRYQQVSPEKLDE